MLLINCSNREKNCLRVLNDIKKENDTLISLAHKDIKFCLGCNSCAGNLEKHCVLDDYITNTVYPEIISNKDIVIACPMYMSNINAILKNLLDRFNPFYNHHSLNGKKFYLIMCGGGSKSYNSDEITAIDEYFKGIASWIPFEFEFLEYFEGHEDLDHDVNYNNKIEIIKNKLKDL